MDKIRDIYNSLPEEEKAMFLFQNEPYVLIKMCEDGTSIIKPIKDAKVDVTKRIISLTREHNVVWSDYAISVIAAFIIGFIAGKVW